MGLAATGAALAVGRFQVALLLATLVTLCLTAVARPMPYRTTALMGILLLPFLETVPFLRGDEYNWTLYYMALLLAVVGLGVLQPRAFPASLGLAYLSYIAVAAFIALWLRDDLANITRMFDIVFALGLYVLLRRATRGERRLVVGGLLAFACAQALLGIAQSWFGWPVFPSVMTELATSQRNYFSFLFSGAATMVTHASGTFHHFNGLASILALALPLSLGWWLSRVGSPIRILVTALLTVGLITTYSRGALAGAILGCLFVMALQRQSSRRTLAVIASCGAVVALLLGLSAVTQYYEMTQNVTVRVNTWELALAHAQESPSSLLLGHGFEHFQSAVLSTGDLKTSRHSGTMAGVHSGPLQLTLEFGFVGVALFALWLFTAFRAGLGPRRTWLSLACLGGTVAFLAQQSLDSWLFDYPGTLMVVLLGLVEAEADVDQEAVGLECTVRLRETSGAHPGPAST